MLRTTAICRSKRLSRKDRAGAVVPGAVEKPWVTLVNEMSLELCRMRRDAKTFSMQEKLLRRSDSFFTDLQPPQPPHQQQQHSAERPEDVLQNMLHEVQLLTVDALSFHLRAVVGSDAAVAERQLQRITRRVMRLIASSSSVEWKGHHSHNADAAAQCVGLLFISASFLCRGIREWELLHHDEVLEVASSEALRRWEARLSAVCKRTISANLDHCFWSDPRGTHIGRQRRWLLTLPVAVVATAAHFGPHQWNNRVNIVALTNILALLHETPLHSGRDVHDNSGRSESLSKILSALTDDLQLFPYDDEFRVDGLGGGTSHYSSRQKTAALPRWALGVVAPLLGTPNFLRTHWWPAHFTSVSKSASTRDSEKAPVLSNTVKLSSMMSAVKSVTVSSRHVPASLVPFNAQDGRMNGNKVGGGATSREAALLSQRSSSGNGGHHGRNSSSANNVVITVNAATRRVFNPVKALDNTLVEVSSLTHDLITSIPFMSTLECRDYLWALHERSFRRTNEKNAAGKLLMEAALRLLLLRYVRLVDKAVERGASRQHQLSALQRQGVDEELSRFREVYQCTSNILLRWNIVDDNIPPAYWAAVKQYLD